LKWRSTDDRQIFEPPTSSFAVVIRLNQAVGPECKDPFANFRIGSERKSADGANRVPVPRNPFNNVGIVLCLVGPSYNDVAML
jgi:hypothetical protein